jgi:hypothetical protein
MRILSSILRLGLMANLVVTTHQVFADPIDHWTDVSIGTRGRLRSVAFGSGIFVSCADDGTILTSSNGLSWTMVTSGTASPLYGVAYGQGRFAAVGQYGTVLVSSNGVEWSRVSSITTNSLEAVAYTDLGFVAVGDGGTIVTSNDGTNWMNQNSGTSSGFVGVGTGFGKVFAAAAPNAPNSPALFWSTNGSMWFGLTNTPPDPGSFNAGFACGNGALLGVGMRGSFYRSTNGVSWTYYSSPPFVYCFGLVFARNQFVAVGGNFSEGGRMIRSSTDGLSWQTRYYQSSEGRLLGVAYGNYRFVAVGDGGSILVSDPMLWLSNPSVVCNQLQMTLNGELGDVYHIQMTTNISAPMWDDIGVVTNLDDTTELTVPFSTKIPGAFYKITPD